MRDSEREPFYDDIAHVIQNTKKIIPPVGFEPETVKHLAVVVHFATNVDIVSHNYKSMK